MSRYLAVAERKLGACFPSSYVEAFRSKAAFTRFPHGELYAPSDCTWLEDSGYPPVAASHTVLVIGLERREGVRPLLLRRAADAPQLEPEVWVLTMSGELLQRADSLIAMFTRPKREPSLEQVATELLARAKRKRRP
jgi:hypothetical protein